MAFLPYRGRETLDLGALGYRIRQARESLGLSQEEFAHLVDKDQTAISDYENGKRKISITELPKFAVVLKVPIIFFFEDEIAPDEFDRALLVEFHKLPEATKSDAIDVMRSLARIANLLP